MKFLQLSSIDRIVPGEEIEASLHLRGDEEYLEDHFPRFPVMPGVLMLEALFQSAMILVRETLHYEPGLVLLESAKNVKFGDFLSPGETLALHVKLTKQEPPLFSCIGKAVKEGKSAVSARLVLRCEDAGQPESVLRMANLQVRQIVQQLRNAGME
ncbi:MAG: hypothetical protein KatS3mg111_2726 [Pirellulaceae bacterium]|nr:MAG: hypothetical protein KatS3mg111_2726 [Pirellulaceae bacterium]